MIGMLLFVGIFLIKQYLDEDNGEVIIAEKYILERDGTAASKLQILCTKMKPVSVTYIMDHGVSITHTHKYCYLSYLNLSNGDYAMTPAKLFDKESLTLRTSVEVPDLILEAARCYLIDRYHYESHLN